MKPEIADLNFQSIVQEAKLKRTTVSGNKYTVHAHVDYTTPYTIDIPTRNILGQLRRVSLYLY